MPIRKQKGKGVLKDVHDFIRDNKLISRGLGFLPYAPAQVASQVAGLVGYGRKRKRKAHKPRMHGKGIFSDLGGGIGSVFGGLGSGIGSVAHGLFGGARHHRRRKKLMI
jgi:hypothetical protein